MAEKHNKAGAYTYAEAGVDVDAGNDFVKAIAPAVRATARPGADGAIGGFGGVFDLAATGYSDPLLVAATDGVGTKLRIAIDAGIFHTVGIDLVAMCVNDLIVQGAEPLFFLDYYACGELKPEAAAAVVGGIAEGCRRAGCALIGGETAEMPGMYDRGDFDLAGFSVGAVERDAMLPRANLAAGDAIIGIASDGVHSNGYSLVRRLVADNGLSWKEAAPFAAEATLGEALLTPTRIYVAPLRAALNEHGAAIKALAHITGGGLTENIPRVLPDGLAARIDLGRIEVPPVFRWLTRLGRIEEAEMLRTFNCGIGMAVVVGAEIADAVVATLTAAGERAAVIGALVAGPSGVVYDGQLNAKDAEDD